MTDRRSAMQQTLAALIGCSAGLTAQIADAQSRAYPPRRMRAYHRAYRHNVGGRATVTHPGLSIDPNRGWRGWRSYEVQWTRNGLRATRWM